MLPKLYFICRLNCVDFPAYQGVLGTIFFTESCTPGSGHCGTSEGLWDCLGRPIEMAPMNKCISRQSGVGITHFQALVCLGLFTNYELICTELAQESQK